jgi:hypothetical protein
MGTATAAQNHQKPPERRPSREALLNAARATLAKHRSSKWKKRTKVMTTIASRMEEMEEMERLRMQRADKR